MNHASAKIKIVGPQGVATIEVRAETEMQAIRLLMARTMAAYNVTSESFSADAPKTAHVLPVDPPPAPPAAQVVDHYEHVHRADGPGSELHYGGGIAEHHGKPFDKSTGRPLPQPVEVAAPVNPAIDASPEVREGLAAAAPPLTAQENAAVPPWEQQAAAPAASAEKKSGRRTNEELAADAGVRLDDVKAWLGEGVRVSKAKIEEFASLHPSAINNQTLDEATQPTTAPEPVVREQQAAPLPAVEEAFGEMPTQAFGDWDPFADQAAPAAPQQAPLGSDSDLPF